MGRDGATVVGAALAAIPRGVRFSRLKPLPQELRKYACSGDADFMFIGGCWAGYTRAIIALIRPGHSVVTKARFSC